MYPKPLVSPGQSGYGTGTEPPQAVGRCCVGVSLSFSHRILFSEHVMLMTLPDVNLPSPIRDKAVFKILCTEYRTIPDVCGCVAVDTRQGI